ncbi:MAG TPA: hypothetical protein VGD67_17690, partial [Pseudonocardiaceae bacterium]
LPELPAPGLPPLLPPLPNLPLLPEVPFPPLPGLPGLPGLEPPPGQEQPMPPLPVAPGTGQRVLPAGEGEVAPEVTSDLTMDSLDLTGLVYDGIVELPTAAGGTVRALRFSISAFAAKDLDLAVPTATGRRLLLDHRPEESVAATDVTLDCTSFSLAPYGLQPVTFTVDEPPPPALVLATLSASGVDIDLVTIGLGTFTVPGASAVVPGHSGNGGDTDDTGRDPAPTES